MNSTAVSESIDPISYLVRVVPDCNRSNCEDALVDILDLSGVDIPAGVFLHPTVGWG